MATEKFWLKKPLCKLSHDEWESLCDGCGRCCLHKLEDEDSGTVYTTQVICRLFDLEKGCCGDYANRFVHVPGCVKLSADLVGQLSWLPKTCAYRLLAEGKKLKWWHPLVSGSAHTVRLAGISVCGKAIAELDADMDNIEDYVVTWFD